MTYGDAARGAATGGADARQSAYDSGMPDDLALLEDLDEWEVADGEHDPRGDDVIGPDNQRIGEIENLLASPSTQRAHVAVVNTGGWFSNKKFLIPLSRLSLRDGRAYTTLTRAQFESAPEWSEGDRNFRSYYHYWSGLGATGSGVAAAAPGGTVDASGGTVVPVVEEQLEVGKRQVEHGIRIGTRVTQRPVEAQVNLREEHVTVDRRPADRAVTTEDMNALRDGVIEVTETSEVPVVSKEARVVEEVVVGKEVREHTETVHDTVRRTDVNIESDRDEDANLDPSGTTQDENDQSVVRQRQQQRQQRR